MKRINVLGILAVLTIIAVSGCVEGEPVYSGEVTGKATEKVTTTIEETKVQALNLWLAMGKNWDSDPDNDGIEVTISPEDRNGELVRTEGTVSAKLWHRTYDAKFKAVKGTLIESWSNVKVTGEDYGIMGATLRLEYEDFVPESMALGWLEITLTTPDGEKFTARQESVILSY